MNLFACEQGRPTADSKELDIDVTLAAPALTFGAATGDVAGARPTRSR